jgi:PIN domain nuclease of toxin-antitoxin system
VTYLLDTGVWLRAVNRAHTVPVRMMRVLEAPRETFGLAAISLWEVAKKVQVGKLSLPKDLAAWFDDALAPNVEVLPLERHVVAESMRLPEFPTRDPADELIVASARIHNLILITTDTKLKGYRHARVQYFKPLLDREKT